MKIISDHSSIIQRLGCLLGKHGVVALGWGPLNNQPYIYTFYGVYISGIYKLFF